MEFISLLVPKQLCCISECCKSGSVSLGGKCLQRPSHLILLHLMNKLKGMVHEC
jgi:hypothetical protein